MYLISLKAIPYIDLFAPSKGSYFSWSDAGSFMGTCNDLKCDPTGYDCGHTVGFCIGMLVIIIVV